MHIVATNNHFCHPYNTVITSFPIVVAMIIAIPTTKNKNKHMIFHLKDENKKNRTKNFTKQCNYSC